MCCVGVTKEQGSIFWQVFCGGGLWTAGSVWVEGTRGEWCIDAGRDHYIPRVRTVMYLLHPAKEVAGFHT